MKKRGVDLVQIYTKGFGVVDARMTREEHEGLSFSQARMQSRGTSATFSRTRRCLHRGPIFCFSVAHEFIDFSCVQLIR